jgi:sterol desaturase/sphingolipid hydroxylase (fatty acid hydroxylase superfamily)
LERWISSWHQLVGGEMTFLALVACAIVTCTIVELVFPAEPGQGWTGRLRNLAYLTIYYGVGLATLATWYAFIPTRSSPPPAPQSSAPLWPTPAFLLATDFVYYWYHRAQHRFPILWAIHELHHADGELNVTTSYRTYWLEAPLQAILVGAPVTLLFGPYAPQLAFAMLVAARFVFLVSHSNVRLSLGPLTPVLCGPQWHRIHHSRLPEHRDRNFAQYFPVLDWLFGTYYAPARNEYPPTGTDGLASTAAVWRTQIRPLSIWRDTMRAALHRSS